MGHSKLSEKALDPADPRLERLPTRHVRINIIAAEDPTQGSVVEAPLSGIEAVALIDEAGGELALPQALPKRDLSAIGVAGPFIESENAGEFVLIANATHASFGQVVVHHSFVMRDNVPRTETQSGDRHHLLTPEFEAELGGMFDEPGMYFDNGWRGN